MIKLGLFDLFLKPAVKTTARMTRRSRSPRRTRPPGQTPACSGPRTTTWAGLSRRPCPSRPSCSSSWAWHPWSRSARTSTRATGTTTLPSPSRPWSRTHRLDHRFEKQKKKTDLLLVVILHTPLLATFLALFLFYSNRRKTRNRIQCRPEFDFGVVIQAKQ